MTRWHHLDDYYLFHLHVELDILPALIIAYPSLYHDFWGCVCDINSRLMTCCMLLRRPHVSLQHFSDYYFFNREKIKYWSCKQDMRALICSHFSKGQCMMKYLYVLLWLYRFESPWLFTVVVKKQGRKKCWSIQ